MRKILLLSLSILLPFLLASASFAQTGYIYLHKRALSKDVSPNFSFTFSEGPTAVSPVILSDQETTFSTIAGLGADASGGVFAIAGNAPNANGNYQVYYRAVNSSTWTALTGAGVDIDGGAAGTRISVAVNNGDVYYWDGSAETNVTGNLPANATNVSDNWQGVQYARLTNNQVWRRTIPSTTWTQIPGVSALRIDAVPNSNQLVYISTSATSVVKINNDGSGATTLGSGLNGINEVAVSGDATIFATAGNLTRRYSGGSWISEPGSLQHQSITGGPASQIWGFNDNIGTRIFSRTETANYIGDENVRIGTNDNSTLLTVAPGTYTVTEAALDGWDVTAIEIYESQSAESTSDVAGGSASLVVSEGEVVHVVFENQLVQPTTVTNVCNASATFLETFGTGTGYGPALTGLTSYHRAGTQYGYGYYGLINNSNQMSPEYTGNFTDHTGNADGRFLGVDAAIEKGTFYRRRFTGLIPGAVYNFSAWAINVNASGPDKPNVSFEVYDPLSGTLINSGNSGDLTQAGIWKQTSFVFTAPQTTIDLVLRNNTLGTSGNDLGIDDISFGVAIPEPITSTTNASCENGGTILITSPLNEGYEYSIDGINYQSSPEFTNLPPATYSVTARYAGGSCVSPASPTMVAPPSPTTLSPIAGPVNPCSGPTASTYTYSHQTQGGTWSVSPLSVATIDPQTGVLTTVPNAAGTATITYTTTGTFCTGTASLDISVGGADCTPMPVTLVSFSVKAQPDNSVLIQWRTALEENNAGFIIERSKALVEFESIAWINDVAGNSSSLNSYRVVDQNPFKGTSYYRLVQIDADGSRHVYQIKSVVIDRIYGPFPNPVNSERIVTVSLDEPTDATIQLLDLAGRNVGFHRKMNDGTSVSLSLPHQIAPGIYLLIIEERAARRQYRIIVP